MQIISKSIPHCFQSVTVTGDDSWNKATVTGSGLKSYGQLKNKRKKKPMLAEQIKALSQRLTQHL